MSRRTDYAEEVEFLMGCGESAERIPARLGLNSDSLARNLHRNGRTDLARQFWRMSRRDWRESRR